MLKNIYNIIILIILFFLIINANKRNNKFSLDKKYKKYIKDCYDLKLFNREKEKKQNEIYLSVCLPVYNMENYISTSLVSIINQSFQNFEIILVNDNSNDKTIDIIKKYQLNDDRIMLINHSKNLGVYKSRIDAVLNSKGKYILFVDPDDMILNPNLFESLFRYNYNLNLDMIEFSVFHQEKWKRKIYFPQFHYFNHFHSYNKSLIFQPELSNIIFYSPNTKNIVGVHCRTIWNKIIRRELMLKTINYLESIFHDEFLITADDTPMNIINFQYANNFSNIYLPGYLYIMRKNSASNLGENKKQNNILYHNYLLYFKFFFQYMKDYNKNNEFLFQEIKINYELILKMKKSLKNEVIELLDEIFQANITYCFKCFLENISRQFKECEKT